MPTPRRNDDPDSIPELPPLDGGPEDDGHEKHDPAQLPLSDDDLGVAPDGEEGVGLDTSTGVQVPVTDLLGDVSEEAENTRFTADNEADPELASADAELLGGSEYGWVADDEEGFEHDPLGPDVEAESARGLGDDGGEEGFDEELGGGDDADVDEVDLPPLDDQEALEDDSDEFEEELLRELAAHIVDDERDTPR